MFLLVTSGYCSPDIWPPNGQLKPNNYIPDPICAFESKFLEETVEEEKCETFLEKSCETVFVEDYDEIIEKNCTKSENIIHCKNVTFITEEEICEDKECESDYLIHMKEEYQYDSKLEMKCWEDNEKTNK